MIDWDSYRDPAFGFMTGSFKPSEPAANAVLFSAEEVLLRMKLGSCTMLDVVDMIRRVEMHCFQTPGLMLRPGPWRHDQESLDDYVGLGAMSRWLSQQALAYGRTSLFRWGPFRLRYQYSTDRNERDAAGWLGRFPALICHLQFAAGERPWLWRRLWWFLSVAFSGSATNQDPWILSWLMLETEAGRSKLGRLAARVYWWRLRRAWPGGLANLTARYFNDGGHPVALAFQELGL